VADWQPEVKFPLRADGSAGAGPHVLAVAFFTPGSGGSGGRGGSGDGDGRGGGIVNGTKYIDVVAEMGGVEKGINIINLK